MRLSARVDYALRAAIELADAGAQERVPVTAEQLATAQQIPSKFLENILVQLRRAGLVRSQRGPVGGHWLARPPAEVSLADVIRAVEGPLANIRGELPENVDYQGPARSLQQVWIALRAAERGILETVTLADVAAADLPPRVGELIEDPEAWAARV